MKQGGAFPQRLRVLEESVRTGFRSEGLTLGVVDSFRQFLALFYAARGRNLPWRRTTDPYRILVSEFMLQRTRVERVERRYPEFLGRFPDAGALARTPVREVLRAWQGLGYNRRALALHRTAWRVMEEFRGEIPLDRATLGSFPGIGSATAGAIVVFSTGRPEVFIETNIRRVFIHLFFSGASKIHDREIEPILAGTLPEDGARDFYYALMDYGSALLKGPGDPNGSLLKGNVGNPNTRSASYARQSPFKGSDREIRGAILRRLLSEEEIEEDAVRDLVPVGPDRLERILRGLERDGFLERAEGRMRCRGDSSEPTGIGTHLSGGI